MNNIQEEQNNFIMKRLKYGSASVVFTAVFVSLVIVINVITSVIHLSNPMIIDMTDQNIFTISDASREMLADVTRPVEFVFLIAPDIYEQLGAQGQGAMIVNLIRSFAAEFDNISITVVDSNRDPQARQDFGASDISNIQQTSIGLRVGGSFRVLSYESFFSHDRTTMELFGFIGERVIVSSILQLTETEMPIVYFTEGQGEDEPGALIDIFTSAGFLVKRIDLNHEEIHEDARIIVIHNPRRDFTGASPDNPTARTDIDRLREFLSVRFGSLMYFVSQESIELPLLEQLLEEYGLGLEHNALVIDPQNSIAGSGGTEIIAQFLGEEHSIARGLHDNISNLPSDPRVIVPNAKPVRLIEDNVGSAMNSLSVVLGTSEHGVVLVDGEEVRRGQIPLMATSVRVETIGTEMRAAMVLVCGSGGFSAPAFMGNPSFSNSDIIYNATRVLGQRRVMTDIRVKPLDDNALIISAASANNWSVIVSIVIPAIFAALGMWVWVKRRYS